jgi:putative metallopeptidase DUF4344
MSSSHIKKRTQERPMGGPIWKIPGHLAAVVVVGLSIQGGAMAQSQTPPAGKIADNDSIFIDGKTFAVIPGRAKADAAPEIQALGARDLGPGAIVFRSGAKLYIVSAPLLAPRPPSEISARDTQFDKPGQIRIQYDPPKDPDLQPLYKRLMEHHYLETLQYILSPLRLPEPLTFKTTQCGVMNAWYRRDDSGPTVTLCYELLKTISQTGPKPTDPNMPTDAVIGQAIWLALHETGHAVFDIFNVPIFGHAEDAADNFATYVMLQMGKDQAKRLIDGAAWAWRAYVADYRTNPVVQEELAGFASNHGQPQERFYNLMCLAYGADPVTFANLTKDGFLPPNRAPDCKYEYKTLVKAFDEEIEPHVDQAMKRQVMDSSWLPSIEAMPTAQK